MFQISNDPAIGAAGWAVPSMALKALCSTGNQTDQFVQLPVNLSSDEIRDLVADVLG